MDLPAFHPRFDGNLIKKAFTAATVEDLTGIVRWAAGMRLFSHSLAEEWRKLLPKFRIERTQSMRDHKFST